MDTDPRIRAEATAGNHPGFELSEAGTRKWVLYNRPSNDQLSFKTDTDVRMVIEQDGNIGIGTTEPTYMLDVSAASTAPALRVASSHASGTPKIRLENGSQNYSIKIDPDNNNALNLFDETNSDARVIVSAANGHLGIGSNPDTVLHVGSVSACATFNACIGTPSDPSSSSEGRIYIKGGKLIVQYNDGGTTRYKSLDLTGTGVTWTHSTTAP